MTIERAKVDAASSDGVPLATSVVSADAEVNCIAAGLFAEVQSAAAAARPAATARGITRRSQRAAYVHQGELRCEDIPSAMRPASRPQSTTSIGVWPTT